jgi:hypothetical protein
MVNAMLLRILGKSILGVNFGGHSASGFAAANGSHSSRL